LIKLHKDALHCFTNTAGFHPPTDVAVVGWDSSQHGHCLLWLLPSHL